MNLEKRVKFLRAAARQATRAAVRAETEKCYWDGINGSREDAEAALKAALKAIDALADAVNLG